MGRLQIIPWSPFNSASSQTLHIDLPWTNSRLHSKSTTNQLHDSTETHLPLLAPDSVPLSPAAASISCRRCEGRAEPAVPQTPVCKPDIETCSRRWNSPWGRSARSSWKCVAPTPNGRGWFWGYPRNIASGRRRPGFDAAWRSCQKCTTCDQSPSLLNGDVNVDGCTTTWKQKNWR